MRRSSNRRGGYIEPYLLGVRRQRLGHRPARRLARALTSPLILVVVPIVAVVVIALVW